MSVKDRRARQREGIRQEIIEAARSLFVKDGYDHVSMRKIAEKIEYSPGTIYLYFQDKAEILERICDETFAKLEKRMHAINVDDDASPLDALRRGLRTYVQFGVDNPNHYIVTFVQAGQIPHANHTAGERCFEHLREAVKRCIDAGQLNCADPEEIAQALWSGAHGVTTLLTTSSFPFIEQSRLIDRVIHILIEGIRKR
jgi:AcrR family transcriptional regulator